MKNPVTNGHHNGDGGNNGAVITPRGGSDEVSNLAVDKILIDSPRNTAKVLRVICVVNLLKAIVYFTNCNSGDFDCRGEAPYWYFLLGVTFFNSIS